MHFAARGAHSGSHFCIVVIARARLPPPQPTPPPCRSGALGITIIQPICVHCHSLAFVINREDSHQTALRLAMLAFVFLFGCVVALPISLNERTLAMDERLAGLRAEQIAVRARLRGVQRGLRTGTQRARRLQHSALRAWHLLPCILDTMLAIYALAGYSPEPAVVYLHECGRRKGWPDRPDHELSRLVEDSFLSFDDERLASLTDSYEPMDDSIYRIALRYAEEWQLVKWGETLNAERGVAPPTSMLISQAQAVGMQLPSAVTGWSRARKIPLAAVRWAARFRMRWKCRMGKLRAREWISVEEARAKVKHNVCAFNFPLLLLRTPFPCNGTMPCGRVSS